MTAPRVTADAARIRVLVSRDPGDLIASETRHGRDPIPVTVVAQEFSIETGRAPYVVTTIRRKTASGWHANTSRLWRTELDEHLVGDVEVEVLLAALTSARALVEDLEANVAAARERRAARP